MDQRESNNLKEILSLQPNRLKRVVDPTSFDFETTEDVPKLAGIVGQDRGNSVINFGLHVDKVGYNIYIAGLPGTGKTTFANALVHDFAQKDAELSDCCYVYNFEDEYKPQVLQLPVGMGKGLKQDMEDFVNNLRSDI